LRGYKQLKFTVRTRTIDIILMNYFGFTLVARQLGCSSWLSW